MAPIALESRENERLSGCFPLKAVGVNGREVSPNTGSSGLEGSHTGDARRILSVTHVTGHTTTALGLFYHPDCIQGSISSEFTLLLAELSQCD